MCVRTCMSVVVCVCVCVMINHCHLPQPTCNNSVEVHRLSTSISSAFDKKSLNVLVSFSGFCNSGVPFVAIK